MNKLKKVAYHLVHWIFVSVGSILLLVASLLLIVSAIICINNLLFLAKSKSVQGTIIELVPKPNDSSERFFLKITYREETTKRRYEFISSLSVSATGYNEDEKIEVFYNRENLEEAKIGVYDGLLGVPFMPIPILLLFVIGFYLIRTGRKIIRQKKR